jgi:hypothetical protein
LWNRSRLSADLPSTSNAECPDLATHGAWPRSEIQFFRTLIRVFDKDGNVLAMLGSPMVVRAVGGEINGVLTIATDITDLLVSEGAHEELVAELLMVKRRERE